MKKVLLFFVLLASAQLCAVLAFAGSGVPAQSLVDLMGDVVSLSPALKLASTKNDTSHIAVQNAYMGFAPRAYATNDNEHEYQGVIKTQNPVYQVGHGDFYNHRWNVNIEQPILDYRVFAKLNGAFAAERKAAYEFSAQQQKLIYSIIEAYVLAAAAADSGRLAQDEEAILNRHLDVVRHQGASGMANSADLSQVQALRDQAHADEISATSALQQAFFAIERLTGKPVVSILGFQRNFKMEKPVPANPQNWIERSESNPEILALEQNVDIASASYEQAKSAFLPRLSLNAVWGYNGAGGSLYGGGSKTTDGTVTLRMTIPIFNYDGNGYVFREEAQHVTEARYGLEDGKLAVHQKVQDALSEAVGNADRAKVLSSAVMASFNHLSDLRKKFAGGTATIKETLDAEVEYVRMRKQLFQSRYNYILNLMKLRQYAGVIDDQDIRYVDSLLDRKTRVMAKN